MENLFLKKMTIENYKGFEAVQSLEFAIPRENKEGSGLTCIVGENNSGKSSVLDAIRKFFSDKKILKEERRNGLLPKICITIASGESFEVKTTNDNSSLVERSEIPSGFTERVGLIYSRRFWSHRFSSESSPQSYNHQKKNEDRLNQGADGNFGQLLAHIARNSELKIKFDKLVREVLPDVTDWSIESEEHGDFVQYVSGGKTLHKANYSGDGVISVFRIAAHLIFETNNSILFIDEPELSLHPQAVKRLLKVLGRASSKHQIIVMTHSPYLVSWKYILNGGKVIRISKANDLVSKSYELTSDLSGIRSLLASIWNPSALDTVAKEFFFSSKLLFVEGRDDASLIRKFIDDQGLDIGYDIMGYGVEGSGNIHYFSKVGQSLGLKCGGLFDSGKDSEINKCKKDFPEFHYIALTTPDIRDKSATKQGLFTDKGEIKAEHVSYLKGVLLEFDKKLV